MPVVDGVAPAERLGGNKSLEKRLGMILSLMHGGSPQRIGIAPLAPIHPKAERLRKRLLIADRHSLGVNIGLQCRIADDIRPLVERPKGAEVGPPGVFRPIHQTVHLQLKLKNRLDNIIVGHAPGSPLWKFSHAIMESWPGLSRPSR